MPEHLKGRPRQDRFQALQGDNKCDVGDRQLLERFVTTRDEAAFAALVERHRRTVWGVCRRTLHQEQDCEDAFQAVFLTLARSAASIRQKEAVAGWLYSVACRIARKARQKSLRRKDCEQKAGAPAPQQAPWSEASCRELQRILDEEVQRLAEKYRTPFVLCCLESMSKAEAARELGWKEGTVSSRVAYARKLLQSRLARRGISLSAVLTAEALLQHTAAAAAPAVLVQGTIQAVLTPLAGETAAAATLSPSAVALAETFTPTLAVIKVKFALLVASVAALVTGLSLAAYHFLGPDEVAQPEVPGELLTFGSPPIPLLKAVDERVYVVAFSPDGTKLITAGGLSPFSGQLKIWDVPGGKGLVKLRGIRGIRTLAFSPNDKIFATAGMSGEIQLRDADTGEEKVSVKGHTAGVNGVAFSSDGALLVSVGLDKIAKLWDVNGLKERKEFRGHTGMIYSVAFFRDGETFVTGGIDTTAKIWSIRAGKEKFTLRGHKDGVEMVAVSPDDKIVATASWDKTIKLWNAETGEETGILAGSEDRVNAVAFSHSGELLASASADGTVCLWDVKKRQLIKILGNHTDQVWSLSFTKGDRYLASGSADTTAKLWDTKELKELAVLKTAEFGPIQALAYSPDGKSVAMATNDNAIRLCDTRTGEVEIVTTGHADVVTCVAYSPAGTMMATGSADKTVKLLVGVTGKQPKQHTLKGHTGAVRAIVFTPDGKKLASAGDDKTIKIWDTESGAEFTTFTGHEAPIRALAFAFDGRTLASGSNDQTVRLWDLGKEADAITLKAHEAAVRAVAFSEGHLASASDDGTVKLWRADKGKVFKLAQGKEPHTLRRHAGGVWALVFAPSGRTLISGSQDKTVIVWDTVTGQSQQFLIGHQEAVTALALHPLGSDLVSGGVDGKLLRWPKAVANGLPAPGDNSGKTPPKPGPFKTAPRVVDVPPPPQRDYAQTYSHPFKGLTGKSPGWEFEGPGAEQCVKFEAGGLRVTLPPEWDLERPGTGLKTNFGVKGDFEITTTYEILKFPAPTETPHAATRLSLAIFKETPMRDVASAARSVGPRIGQAFVAWSSILTGADEKPVQRSKFTRFEATTGRLRLVRAGGDLYFGISDGPDGEFEFISKQPFGTEELRDVRVMGTTGGLAAALDVRFTDFRIRADAIPNMPAVPSPDNSPNESAPNPARRLRLMLVLGLAAALAFVLGMTLVLRQRRAHVSKVAAAKGKQADREETATTLSFVCSECGKKLRVKAELAGKKARCPQCGKIAIIPGSEPGALASTRSKRRLSIPKTRWLLAAAVLAVVAGITGWLLWPAGEKPSFLNVTLGNQSVPDVEESGFHSQEYDREGEPFRWTNGKGTLVIPIDKNKPPQALAIKIYYVFRAGKTGKLRIIANNRELLNLEPVPHWKCEEAFDLRGIDLGNELVLDIISDVFVPKGVMDNGSNADARTLGVQVRSVKLLATVEEANVR